jgi:hypothetical protein
LISSIDPEAGSEKYASFVQQFVDAHVVWALGWSGLSIATELEFVKKKILPFAAMDPANLVVLFEPVNRTTSVPAVQLLVRDYYCVTTVPGVALRSKLLPQLPLAHVLTRFLNPPPPPQQQNAGVNMFWLNERTIGSTSAYGTGTLRTPIRSYNRSNFFCH